MKTTAVLLLAGLVVWQGATGGMNIPRGEDLPAACLVGALYYKTGSDDGLYECSTVDTWTKNERVGGAGGAAWGGITGTLSAQTDLQTALDTKGTSNFSGVYADLTGKPTLFDGVYASLTGKPTLGTAAATAIGDYATAAQGTLATNAAAKSSNLSDLTNAVTARTNLGLGSLATQSGTFSGTSSGTNTGDQTTVSGNAGTATTLQTARTINGTSFNGSANITVTAAGSTLSDTVTVTKGGTGLTALGTGLQVLRTNAGASAMEWATPSGGSNYRTLVTLGSDQTDSAGANTYADCTGLSFAVTAGTRYHFYAQIYYTAGTPATTGSGWSINGPTATNMAYKSTYTLSATTVTTNFAVAYNIPAASNAATILTGGLAVLEGTVLPSANGTIIVRFMTEVNAVAVVCKAGSTIEWW